MTRPAPSGFETARALRSAGFRGPILFAPALSIVAVAPGDIPGGTLVFTSRHAVTRAAELGLADRPAVAVGQATAAAARLHGLACQAGPGDVEGLEQFLLRHTAGPLVHLHGRHVTSDLAQALRRQGRQAEARVVYDQRARPLTDAARRALGDGDSLLPLFSPRSAQIVARQLDAPRAGATVVALSAAVAQAWPFSGPLHIADQPTAAAMIARIGALVALGGER